MGARTDKADASPVLGDGINEYPVRFQVAVAEAPEVPKQGMIAASGRQGLARAEQVDGGAQLGQVLAAALHPLHVLAEAAGDGGRPHRPSER